MTTQDLVPKRWRDAFVLAMRERDADGRRIGDALAEVEQFCQDSGRNAQDAFGPAGAYAAELVAEKPPARFDPRTAASLAVGLVGMLLVIWAVPADDGRLTITLGDVLALPLILVGSPLTTRLAYRRALAAAVTLTAIVAALVVALIVLTTPLFTMPAAAAVAIGAVLLVGRSVDETRRVLRTPSTALIAAPWEPDESVRRRNVRAGIAAAWMMPAATAVAVLLAAAALAVLR